MEARASPPVPLSDSLFTLVSLSRLRDRLQGLIHADNRYLIPQPRPNLLQLRIFQGRTPILFRSPMPQQHIVARRTDVTMNGIAAVPLIRHRRKQIAKGG